MKYFRNTIINMNLVFLILFIILFKTIIIHKYIYKKKCKKLKIKIIKKKKVVPDLEANRLTRGNRQIKIKKKIKKN